MAAQAATSTAAQPLATPGRRSASRTPQPTYHEPTFRTWPPERRTCRDGTQVTIIVCEELVGGRWEPFCSIHEHHPAQPTSIGQLASSSNEGA